MNTLYILPFISALIGWVTNFLAIKMLFHPRKKISLGIFTIQGVFPKRQKVLAERLGKLVANELFSLKDISHLLESENLRDDIDEIIDKRLDIFLNEKLVASLPMLAMFMNEELKETIKTTIKSELNAAIPEILQNLSLKLEKEVNVENTVYEKVVGFSPEKLEAMLFSIMKKEFRFIELLGAILGFIIGLLQLLIVRLTY